MNEKPGLTSLSFPMPTPSPFENDLLVDDGDATVVHFRRHGSWEGAVGVCDQAVPGIASWQAGRRAWQGAQHRKHSTAIPVYTDGPLWEHRVGVIPQKVLDVVDKLQWRQGGALYLGRYAEGQQLVPHVERLLLDAANEVAATHLFGFAVEPASVTYLHHKRAGDRPLDPHTNGVADIHVHDDAWDPWRRWLSAVFYFTDPADYDGGDLIIIPTGERIRPGRGDVVMIRGDVEHFVKEVTRGTRSAFTAHVGEPRWWSDPQAHRFDLADPDGRCQLLDDRHRAGALDGAELRRQVAFTWLSCMFPEDQLPPDRWLAMFRAAGFVADHAGRCAPTEPISVFRACAPGGERRLTWTSRLDTARYLQAQAQYGRTELWRAIAPPEAVHAWFDYALGKAPGWGDFIEVVVDPDLLDDLERIG